MRVLTAEQRTEAWHAARCGKLTASRTGEAFSQTKAGAWASSREDLISELVEERLTGQSREYFETRWMRKGTEMEPEILAAVEARLGVFIDSVGLVEHSYIRQFAGSPDGLIDAVWTSETEVVASAAVEAKWRKPEIHLALLESFNPDGTAQVPDIHIHQVLSHFVITGCSTVWYASFNESFADRLILIKCQRQDFQHQIVMLESNVRRFLGEVDSRMERIACRALPSILRGKP